MKNNVIIFDFNSQEIQFNEEGWFNATIAAERFGKRPVDWLTQDGTKEYIAALAAILKCDPKSLLKTRRGNNGGTWLHPKLAVRFAQWLDVTFAVWCDVKIDNLLRGHVETAQDWRRARHEASSTYKVMSKMLNIVRFLATFHHTGPSLSK